MQKKYYILIFVIIAVAAVFSSSVGIKLEAQHPAIQELALLAGLIPSCLLLYFVSKDEKFKNGSRIAAKIGIAFLLFCYICGAIAEFVLYNK